MSDFARNENKLWQKEVREKIDDCVQAAACANHPFNEWEVSFISDIGKKLSQDIINVTPKQYAKLWDLWEKI